MKSIAESITEQDIAALPRWARIALAARCADRVQMHNASVLGQDYERVPIAEGVIVACQKVAAAGSSDIVDYDDNWSDLDDWYGAVGLTAEAAFFGANDPSDAYKAISEADYFLSLEAQTLSRKEGIERARLAIRRDLDLLSSIAIEHQWTDNTPIPSQFFSFYSEFDLSTSTDSQLIIDVSAVVNQKLLEYFARYPKHLYGLGSRQFEELIAEIWDAFGFEVELTRRTRDGGKDIIAIRSKPERLMYLIECKRYGPNNPVGIDIVQRLFGVTYLEGADKGVIVTTSRFTKPALETLRKANWLLEGHDFNGLSRWLDKYQKIQMYKELNLIPPSNLWK